MSFNKALLSIKPFIAQKAVSQFLRCFIMVPYNFFIMFSQKKIVWKFHWECRQIEFTNYIRRKCSSFNYWYYSQLLLLHIPRGSGAFVAYLTNFASAIFLQWKLQQHRSKKLQYFWLAPFSKGPLRSTKILIFTHTKKTRITMQGRLCCFFPKLC